MNKAETIAALAFTALGVFMFAETWKAPYLIEGVPGPAFLPRWIAGGLVGTGLMLSARAAVPGCALKQVTDWPTRRGWARVGLMLAALAAAFLLLNKLGFLVTMTLFIAVVIYGLGTRSWLMLAAVPVGTSVALYLVFAVWLRVPLPKGVLGFLG